MTIPNTPNTPPIWDEASLARQAQAALDDFVDRRLAEPTERYLLHLKKRKPAVVRLFRELAKLDRAKPDIAIVKKILFDPDLQSAFRYVAGPPVSSDDLGVLVTRKPKRISRAAIESDPTLAAGILRLICQLADSERFPWLRAERSPTRRELEGAIRATAVLQATQTMQTERRGYGREVEAKLQIQLKEQGLTKVATPNKGRVMAPSHMPAAREFYGECTLQGRRADLLIGLRDGRSVAVEAKDSSSVVNSVKRVLNDTAAKARHWQSKFGETVVPVALLSGVFAVDNLKTAQSAGLYLAWSHDLGNFVQWIVAHQ